MDGQRIDRLRPGTRVLVTGGAGFIGSHLVEALLERGCRVAVLDNLSTGRLDNIAHLLGRDDFTFAEDSVTNEVVLDHLMREGELVFHLAAAVGVELIIREPVRSMETNILGTHAVLRAAHRYRRRVVLSSTSEIYGKGDQVPFREDADRLLGPTTTARWNYSSSKAACEYLALAYHRELGVETIIPRLFNVVGVRQTGRYGMVIPRFVSQAVAGDPLTVYGDGEQTRCFVDVRDAVDALLGLADCQAAVGEVANVGSTEELRIVDLARWVLAEVEPTSPPEDRIRFVPYSTAYEPGFEDMRRRVPDLSKIESLIGWRPTVALADTLREVIAEHRR